MPRTARSAQLDVEPHARRPRSDEPRRRSQPPSTARDWSPAMKPGTSSTGGALGLARGTAELPVGHQPGQLQAVAKLAAERYVRGLTQRKQVGHRSKPTGGEARPPALGREPLARPVGSQR